MYTATIYTVSIVSPGVTIEEEHIARETLNRWNAENGKEKAKIYLPLPSDSTAEPESQLSSSSANTTTKITLSLQNLEMLRHSKTKRHPTA